MKILIGRTELFEGLQRVFSVVPQKPTLPVLSNFLLKVSGGKLSISGTDMDISISTVVECTAEGEGTVTINAKRFIEIIRELPDGDINLTIDDDRVTVDFKQGESSIMGMSSEGYPGIRESLDGNSIGISGDDFVEMVEKTSFSVAVDRTRLALTGVYWKVTSDDVIMVATDGHRLSLFEKSVASELGQEVEAIVPPKALNQVVKIYSSGIKLVNVSFATGAVLFDFGSTMVFTKLIEGPYPNFRQVIPVDNSKKVTISKESLLAAVRRVSVLSNAITHQIRLSVSSGSMELTTTNADIGGQAREAVSVKYEGESLIVGYNASFLLEILRKIETDEVVLELESPTTACIIRPVKGEDQVSSGDYMYLIMPLRISD
ncbi:DNA polymerase III subunit beta [Candidatus Latescibacterota bacterium]